MPGHPSLQASEAILGLVRKVPPRGVCVVKKGVQGSCPESRPAGPYPGQMRVSQWDGMGWMEEWDGA